VRDVHAALCVARNQFLASKSEVSTVIEANDVKTQLAKRFFPRRVTRNEWLSDFRDRPCLQMETRHVAGNLNSPANVQPAHAPS
jgi:hypothetical protein